jgi:hypothetical protein
MFEYHEYPMCSNMAIVVKFPIVHVLLEIWALVSNSLGIFENALS